MLLSHELRMLNLCNKAFIFIVDICIVDASFHAVVTCIPQELLPWTTLHLLKIACQFMLIVWAVGGTKPCCLVVHITIWKWEAVAGLKMLVSSVKVYHYCDTVWWSNWYLSLCIIHYGIAFQTLLDPSTTFLGDCTTGDLRLVGSESQESFTREGRVEICINNAWGTVCNRLFGPEDAATACAQLGGFYRESK